MVDCQIMRFMIWSALIDVSHDLRVILGFKTRHDTSLLILDPLIFIQ